MNPAASARVVAHADASEPASGATELVRLDASLAHAARQPGLTFVAIPAPVAGAAALVVGAKTWRRDEVIARL